LRGSAGVFQEALMGIYYFGDDFAWIEESDGWIEYVI